MLRKIKMIMFSMLIAVGFNVCAFAEDVFIEEEFIDAPEQTVVEETESEIEDDISVDALNNYQVEGSLFEKITTLEQEKVVMQLEKDRAQLDLELERLNAERIKLQMELDTLSGRAEQQQHELEAAKAQLDIQTEKLKRQMEAIDEEDYEPVVAKQPVKKQESDVSKRYRLINVVGVGNQLQATIEDVDSGQNKRIAVGKELDGYIVKSISLNDGIVLSKDGDSESVNIGK